MNRRLILATARDLMTCPAAPFHEFAVRSTVEKVCRDHHLPCRRDRYGNLLLELKRGRVRRPMVLVAHLDHPGFDLRAPLGNGSWRARFLGGVAPDYFRAGTRVRFLPGGELGRLGKPLGRPIDKEYELIPDAPLASRPAFAVWHLEDFAFRRGLIHGRACDDLIGVTAILTTLIAATRSSAPIWLVGAITRAEEIGFGGALAMAGSRAIPRDALIVSLETSRELPPVQMGQGVIIRVGDRSSVFDSRATRFLTEIAGELLPQSRGFKHQRALMSGGSCEGTVFAEAGFKTAALCVALGNYHNCGPRRRIAAEYVSLADVTAMVSLLTAAAGQFSRFDELTGRLRQRLARLAKESRNRLVRTAASG